MSEKLQSTSTVRVVVKTDPDHDRLTEEQLAALLQLVNDARARAAE